MRKQKHIFITAACAFCLAVFLMLKVTPKQLSPPALPNLSHPTPAASTQTAALSPQYRRLVGTPGFWRVGQTANGVWWFINPSGQHQFLNNVTTVVPNQGAGRPGGVGFVSGDWHGNTDEWARLTAPRITEIGFTGVGAWSDPSLLKQHVPISLCLSLLQCVPPESARWFSPGWRPVIDHAVAVQVAGLQDNPYLIGYYSDNEFDWDGVNTAPATYFDGLAANDPNRVELLQTIHSLWPTIAGLNHDWNLNLASWNEFEQLSALPSKMPEAAYSRLRSAWLSHLAEFYFRTTTAIIHQYDKNHLILGVRFKGYAPPEVALASRGYTDAQSINLYLGDALLDREQMSQMESECNQPIVITEYSFHALDGRSGNQNTFGFPAQVTDQRARADGYQMITRNMARITFLIGAEWFQWSDEPSTGRGDGEDVNFGIVDVHDRPYELLAAAVHQTVPELNGLHENSATDDGAGIWRKNFLIQRPSFAVPYISGSSSDQMLPAQSGLVMQRAQTVGLERDKFALPKLTMAWNEQGLRLRLEMPCDSIRASAPTSDWWAYDNVEFWLRTQPTVATDTDFDALCYDYFFVPPSSDWPAVLGRWHRYGDALSATQIPAEGVSQVCHVENGRYTVDICIPFSALGGSSPKAGMQLAFNLCAFQREGARSYFWSAPKEVQTHLHPCTWGTVTLAPQGK